MRERAREQMIHASKKCKSASENCESASEKCQRTSKKCETASEIYEKMNDYLIAFTKVLQETMFYVFIMFGFLVRIQSFYMV